jgi:general stress protein 26
MMVAGHRGWPCLLLAVALGTGCDPAPAPPPGSDPAPTVLAPESEAARAAAREIIATARYATLVTVGPDGHPQARVVDPFAPDSQFVVRVATNARSRKAAEIAADGRVTLLYFDAAGSSYVTLIGMAEAVGDTAERARWWKEDWAAFYEDRNRGEDYLLIRVRPTRLEISSERHGIRNDSVTWRPVLVPLP